MFRIPGVVVPDDEEEFTLTSKTSLLSCFGQKKRERVLVEADIKKAAELNLASLSCKQFKLGGEEKAKFDKYKSRLQEIDDMVNALGRERKRQAKEKEELQYCDDPVLCEILNEKLTAYKDKISCRIDRENLQCEVKITGTEAKDAVVNFFTPFLNSDPLVETSIANGIGQASHVKIIFPLRCRDNVINASKLIKEVTDIPVSRIEFKGC